MAAGRGGPQDPTSTHVSTGVDFGLPDPLGVEDLAEVPLQASIARRRTDDTERDFLSHSGEELLGAGRAAEAVVAFQLRLAIAEAAKAASPAAAAALRSGLEESRACLGLAHALCAEGRPQEAQRAARAGLAHAPRGHVLAGRLLCSLAKATVLRGGAAHAREAATLQKAAATAASSHVGLLHPLLVHLGAQWANALDAAGLYRESAEALERVASTAQSVLGARHRAVAALLLRLGTVQRKAGRSEEALPHFERALVLMEQDDSYLAYPAIDGDGEGQGTMGGSGSRLRMLEGPKVTSPGGASAGELDGDGEREGGGGGGGVGGLPVRTGAAAASVLGSAGAAHGTRSISITSALGATAGVRDGIARACFLLADAMAE